jgi:lysozyme family protein
MIDRYPKCLAFVLNAEGGFSNNPADPGGATNHGVTQRVYDAYRVAHQLPVQSVINILDSEVSDIYKSEYWDAVCGDQLPVGVDLAAFDFAVNAGMGESSKVLQTALGVTADGVIGHQTITAAQAVDSRALANHMLDLRAQYYQNLAMAKPQMYVFLHGWINRVAALRATL